MAPMNQETIAPTRGMPVVDMNGRVRAVVHSAPRRWYKVIETPTLPDFKCVDWCSK